MEIPAAAQRNSDPCSGLDNVSAERGLKIGGWYDTIIAVGELRASAHTAGVKLEQC